MTVRTWTCRITFITVALLQTALADNSSAATSKYLLQHVQFDQSIDCSKASNNYQQGQCRGREVQLHEQALLAQLAKLQILLAEDREALATLNQAHETWLAWQWHEAKLCANNSGFSESGTGFGIAMANCRAALIATRQQQLTDYFNSYQSRLRR